LCSFDAFLRLHALTDPALQQLAVIVRGADTGRLDLAPQPACWRSRWACLPCKLPVVLAFALG
jgi:hypothetical protein